MKSNSKGKEQKDRVKEFRDAVWRHYRKNGRHALPWRKTRDAYQILVSEIMLQQTQVERVVPLYKKFLKQFPKVRALAEAPLAAVLRAWQGLGYNRRAKFLHEAAKDVVLRHAGIVPREYEALIALSGIGTYTAAAVRAFAFNEPDVFIETNIRTAFIRHFFPRKKKVRDEELLPLLEKALDRKKPREWYFALMDYGSHLKKTKGNASRRSAHHTKQKPFKGSDREVRGALLKALALRPFSEARLLSASSFGRPRIKAQLSALQKEGLISKKSGKYTLGA